jgi:diguanylate cyclase (GGDEF)-like protein
VQLLAEGNLELERITNQFIDQNLESNDSSEAVQIFLRQFIQNCFRVFYGNVPDRQQMEKLLGNFELLDIADLDGNNVLTIEKTISNLKIWLEMFPKNNKHLMEDFFQRSRVLMIDILIKMYGTRLKSHNQDINHLRRLLVEMVSKINDYQEELRTVIPRLRAMGINNCYVYLYDKPIIYKRGDTWKNPAFVNMVMGYNDEDWVMPADGYRISWQKILKNEWLPQHKRYTMMLYPLFVEKEHLGLILLQGKLPNINIFESLVIEMSCALKLSLLFYEREQIDDRLQEVVKELEAYNQKLDNISQTDELTGLHNRRGFLNLAKNSLDLARKKGKSGLLFFADMDGLKKINDQYGHDEGDIAIKAMGNILENTFRNSDIIARIGGDEFTILTIDSDFNLLPMIQTRLDNYIRQYNCQSGKPYNLSITIGAVPFNSTENISLESLISRADELLYEQKKHKMNSN